MVEAFRPTLPKSGNGLKSRNGGVIPTCMG